MVTKKRNKRNLSRKIKLNCTEAKMMIQIIRVHLLGAFCLVIFVAISIGEGLVAVAVFLLAAIRAIKSPSFLATLNSVKVQGRKTSPLINAIPADSQDGPVNKLM